MADKKISELPVATLPLTTEDVEIVQGGVNKKTPASSFGGGTVTSVSGTTNRITSTGGATPVLDIDPAYDTAITAEIAAALRNTRTVTGADAIVQADDNALIIFNSATPFNFTLDQLTANSKVTFINIGAGAVTFVNGAGVTLVGSAVLPGAVNTDYPSALVVYLTATTPRIVSGTSKIDLNTTSTAGGTITLDCNGQVERIFVGSASFATPKTIALSNDTNALVIDLFLTLTDVAAVLTFPSTFTMPVTDARWNDGAHTFTPANTGKHEFNAVFDGTDWNMVVTNPYA